MGGSPLAPFTRPVQAGFFYGVHARWAINPRRATLRRKRHRRPRAAPASSQTLEPLMDPRRAPAAGQGVALDGGQGILIIPRSVRYNDLTRAIKMKNLPSQTPW